MYEDEFWRAISISTMGAGGVMSTSFSAHVCVYCGVVLKDLIREVEARASVLSISLPHRLSCVSGR